MCKFKNGFGSIRVADSRSIILSVWTDNRTQSVSKLTLNVGRKLRRNIKDSIMELKDYISETIRQIVLGITEAQKNVEGLDIIVNPNITIGQNGEFFVPSKKSYNIQRRVQNIDMDINLTVTESETNSIGGKIGVSVFGVGADSSGVKETSNQNRVRFSIPICFPVTKVDDI